MAGYARLYVSDNLVQHAPTKIEKPKAGAITWDAMEVKELFDTFAAFLLLPEHFTIVGIFFDVALYQWLLLLESAELPAVDPAQYPPRLSFAYQRTDDGKVRLTDYSILP